MTKAPERIWAGNWLAEAGEIKAWDIGEWRDEYWSSVKTIEYLHIDHALALVAAEREACADTTENFFAPGTEEETTSEIIAEDIRARTNDDAQAALERVKQEARNEALREAADLAKYEGEEFAGMREGVMFDRLSKKILDLITEDQIDE